MAVVPYSSDVLCVHKTRLQRLYMDVQPLKTVQMVSQSQFFRDLYLLDLIRLLLFSKKLCKILFKILHKRNIKLSHTNSVLNLIPSLPFGKHHRLYVHLFLQRLDGVEPASLPCRIKAEENAGGNRNQKCNERSLHIKFQYNGASADK